MADAFIFGLLTGAAAGAVGVGAVLRSRLQAARRDARDSRAAMLEAERALAESVRGTAAADALIEKMPTPLFVVDRGLKVLRSNSAALALTGKDVTGTKIDFAFRRPEFVRTITAAIDTAASQSMQLDLPVPIERSFVVQAEPLPGAVGQGVAKGEDEPAAIVMMLDATSVMRSEQLRVDFVANVSHELRTPLSSLIGFIETLRGPAADDPEAQERFLKIMQEQADRMYRLIADLLSLSRIEMDEHSPPTARVDLRGVIEKVTDTLGMKAKTRDMAIETHFPDSLPEVTGDEDQLTQVFQNLVDNALKYGNPGTPVTVKAEVEGGRVAIAVTDRGAGIPREHLPRLTERFYRIDAARSREMGGTGLGLAIVKHIVNRHRGKMIITSDAGVGSTFRIFLPIAK